MEIKAVYKIYELHRGLLKIPEWATYKEWDTVEDVLEYLRDTGKKYDGYVILLTTSTYCKGDE